MARPSGLRRRPRGEAAMAEFTVNPTRFDPYKNFKFRLKWDGRFVAGVSHVSALRRVTEVVEHREGGDPSTARKSPGRTQFEPITVERGVTYDHDFEEWANKVWRLGAGLGSEVGLADFRKDVAPEISNATMLSDVVKTLSRSLPAGAAPCGPSSGPSLTLGTLGVRQAPLS